MATNPKRRRLTAAEFEAVRPLLNLAEHRIDAAYAALVNDEVLQQIADRHGYKSRQAVNDAINAVWATFQAYKVAQQAEIAALNSNLPDGWEIVSIAAPVDLIKEFKAKVNRRTIK